MSTVFKFVMEEASGNKISHELSTKALELAGRTQVVLLAREFIASNCRARANHWITNKTFQSNQRRIIGQITGMIEADKSAAEAPAKKAQADKAQADAKIADTKQAEAQAAAKQAEVAAQKAADEKAKAEAQAKLAEAQAKIAEAQAQIAPKPRQPDAGTKSEPEQPDAGAK